MKFDEKAKIYISESNSHIRVEIGDAKQEEFLPRVKLCAWDNESNISFGIDVDKLSQAKGSKQATPTVEIEDDTVKWTDGNTTEAHFYPLETFEGGEDGGFEFEVIWSEKPESNIINLTMNTPKDLEFYYQAPLTQEEIDEGCERPENVVGSYAVYHSSKQGDYSRMGGKNYKTGKAFHIYRPEAVDADGHKSWCELYIDVEGQIATITVPQEFLDGAVYPVVVDPTFGYTSVGGSYNTSNSSKPRLCRFEINIEEAALVDSLTVYGRYQTGTPIYLGTAIYSSTEDNTFPDILLATDLGNLTISSGISQWYTSQIQSILYPSGTYLWLAWWGMRTTSYGFRYFYDASSVHIIAVSNGWPMPFPEASNEENWYSFRGVNLTSEGNRIASIYATYEELPTYTLSLATSGSGSVQGSGDFVEGESITIYAFPYSYYQFVNWTDDDNNDAIISTDANYTFSMPGYAVNYTANFEFIPRDFTAVWTDTLDGTWDGWAYDIYGNGWMFAELNNGYYVAVHLRFPDISYVPGKRYYLRYINWNWSRGSTFRIVGDKSNGGQLYGHEEYTTRTQTTAEIVTDTGFGNLDVTDIVEELAQIQDWNGVIQLFIFPTENTYEGTGIEIYAGIVDVEAEDSDCQELFAELESGEDIGFYWTDGTDSYFEAGVAYFNSGCSAFFRFPALDLPENATITKAEIEFVLYYNGENEEGTCEVRIHRVLDDDPISPTDGTELLALPLSTEYVDWDVPSVHDVGAMIADVDVTSLYQNPENPIMFIIKENNIEGTYRYVAWAYLKVEYEEADETISSEFEADVRRVIAIEASYLTETKRVVTGAQNYPADSQLQAIKAYGYPTETLRRGIKVYGYPGDTIEQTTKAMAQLSDTFRPVIIDKEMVADTHRLVHSTGIGLSDSLRRVFRGDASAGDTFSRAIRAYGYPSDIWRQVTIYSDAFADSIRGAIKEYSTEADALRPVIRQYLYPGDTIKVAQSTFLFDADTYKATYRIDAYPADTLREITLELSEIFFADATRQIQAIQAYNSDTLRRLGLAQHFASDTLRRVITGHDYVSDALLKIIASYDYDCDTWLTTLMEYNCQSDTMRQNISEQVCFGDAVLKSTKIYDYPAITKRYIIKLGAYIGDTYHVIQKLQVCDVDTLLKAIAEYSYVADILRQATEQFAGVCIILTATEYGVGLSATERMISIDEQERQVKLEVIKCPQ